MINENDLRVTTEEDDDDVIMNATIKLFPQDLIGIECDIFYAADKYRLDWREREDNIAEWKNDVAENVIKSFQQIAVHFYNLGLEDRRVIR
jgi:hypothetical protein